MWESGFMNEILLVLSVCFFAAAIYWGIMVYRAVVCVPIILLELKALKKEIVTMKLLAYQEERRKSGAADVEYLD